MTDIFKPHTYHLLIETKQPRALHCPGRRASQASKVVATHQQRSPSPSSRVARCHGRRNGLSRLVLSWNYICHKPVHAWDQLGDDISGFCIYLKDTHPKMQHTVAQLRHLVLGLRLDTLTESWSKHRAVLHQKSVNRPWFLPSIVQGRPRIDSLRLGLSNWNQTLFYPPSSAATNKGAYMLASSIENWAPGLSAL